MLSFSKKISITGLAASNVEAAAMDFSPMKPNAMMFDSPKGSPKDSLFVPKRSRKASKANKENNFTVSFGRDSLDSDTIKKSSSPEGRVACGEQSLQETRLPMPKVQFDSPEKIMDILCESPFERRQQADSPGSPVAARRYVSDSPPTPCGPQR